jgi:hypothetical protein
VINGAEEADGGKIAFFGEETPREELEVNKLFNYRLLVLIQSLLARDAFDEKQTFRSRFSRVPANDEKKKPERSRKTVA